MTRLEHLCLLSVAVFFNADGTHTTQVAFYGDVFDFEGIPTWFESIDGEGIPDLNLTVIQPRFWHSFDNGFDNMFKEYPEPYRVVSNHCTVAVPLYCLSEPYTDFSLLYQATLVTLLQRGRVVGFISEDACFLTSDLEDKNE